MMLSRILNKAGVKPEEETSVRLCMLHALATGCFIPIIASVPMALFLSKFNSGALSYGFIANAILTLLIGAIYVFFEKRVLFFKLQLGVASSIVITLFLSWVGISLTSSGWVIASVLILSWTIFDFAFFEFWCVLNRLFNLQQAKRLFGLIGMVRAISGIITGLISPWLIKLLGLNQLMLIATAAAFFAVVVLYKIKKRYPEAIDQHEADEEDESDETAKRDQGLTFGKALKNKYFLSIFIFSTLMMLITLNFDLLWNTVAEEHYPDQDKLAAFLSIFSAFLAGSVVFFSFISVPMLKRFGVIKAIIFQPLVMLIIGTMIFIFAWFLPDSTLIFFAILVLYLFYTSYSSSIRAPSILVLFQPLLHKDRSWIQSKLEAIINPVASGIGGLLLLLITHTLGISVKILLFPLLVLTLVFLLVAQSLKSGYIAALTEALTKPYLFKPNLATIDKNILPLLQQKMASPFPEEVLFVLSSLENLDQIEYQRILKKAIESEHENIRKYVVSQFIKYPDPNFLAKIRMLAISDVSNEVKSTAYEVLASSNEDRDIHFVLTGLEQQDPVIKLGAITGIIKYLKPHYAVVKEKLLSFLESEIAENRQLAAKVIGDNDIEELLPQLLTLTKDKEFTVRDSAIIALGTMKNSTALLELLETENVDLLPGSIMRALLAAETGLIEKVTPIFTHLKPNVQCLVVRAASYMDHDDASLTLLKDNLSTEDLSVRFYILTGLIKKNYRAIGNDAINVENLIVEEFNTIVLFRSKIAMIPNESSALILKELLQRNVRLAKERLLMLLSFIYDPSEIAKVKNALKSENADKVSYALEMLDVLLLSKHKADILPLFTESEISMKDVDFNRLLQEILENKDNIFNKWIIVATLYYVGEHRIQEVVSLLTPYVSSSEAEIKETAQWAVKKLQ